MTTIDPFTLKHRKRSPPKDCHNRNQLRSCSIYVIVFQEILVLKAFHCEPWSERKITAAWSFFCHSATSTACATNCYPTRWIIDRLNLLELYLLTDYLLVSWASIANERNLLRSMNSLIQRLRTLSLMHLSLATWDIGMTDRRAEGKLSLRHVQIRRIDALH